MMKEFKKLDWVPDGYNHTLVFGSSRVVVRPMTHAERLDLWSLGPDSEMLSSAVQSRIVYGELDLSSLDATEWRKALDLIIRPGDKQEVEDMRNLASGVKLEKGPFAHLNAKGCGWCQKFWYDPITGTDAKQDGKILARPDGSGLLCDYSACPNGTIEKQNAFSPKNRLAYMHFLRCESSGRFPDDPIVKRNAEVIQRARKAKEGSDAGIAAGV